MHIIIKKEKGEAWKKPEKKLELPYESGK